MRKIINIRNVPQLFVMDCELRVMLIRECRPVVGCRYQDTVARVRAVVEMWLILHILMRKGCCRDVANPAQFDEIGLL